jgi:DNA-directed RNA polymerase specialized sigma24 family protein
MRGTHRQEAAVQPRVGGRSDLQKERFGQYFSRLFAYALAATGEDESAREVAISSFSQAFAMPDMRVQEFEVALFRAARDLCRTEFRGYRHHDSLNPRERDVLSLLFDARLRRAQISELLGIGQPAVGSALVRGLKKSHAQLKAGAARPAVPSLS